MKIVLMQKKWWERRVSDKLFWGVVFGLLIALNVFGVVMDVYHTWRYGGSDLRIRVVGTRVATNGRDPYTYAWKPGDPEKWLDPTNHPQARTSRLTVTPLMLVLHRVFSDLPYLWIRWLWLVGQWSLFLITWKLAVSITRQDLQKTRLLHLLFLMFGASHFWRYHLELGQVHILYVFVWMLSMYVIKIKKNHLATALFGVLGVLRPSFLIMSVGLMVRRRAGKYWLVGMLVGLLLPILVFGKDGVWSDYAKSMAMVQNYSHVKFGRSINPKIYYPLVIENGASLGDWLRFPSQDTSIKHFLWFFGNVNMGIGILIAGVLTIFLTHVFLRNVHGLDLWLLDFCFVMVTELLLPAPRYSYAQLLWVPILVWHIINTDKLVFSIWKHAVLLGLAGLLWFVNGWLGEFVFTWGILIWMLIVALGKRGYNGAHD